MSQSSVRDEEEIRKGIQRAEFVKKGTWIYVEYTRKLFGVIVII